MILNYILPSCDVPYKHAIQWSLLRSLSNNTSFAPASAAVCSITGAPGEIVSIYRTRRMPIKAEVLFHSTQF